MVYLSAFWAAPGATADGLAGSAYARHTEQRLGFFCSGGYILFIVLVRGPAIDYNPDSPHPVRPGPFALQDPSPSRDFRSDAAALHALDAGDTDAQGQAFFGPGHGKRAKRVETRLDVIFALTRCCLARGGGGGGGGRLELRSKMRKRGPSTSTTDTRVLWRAGEQDYSHHLMDGGGGGALFAIHGHLQPAHELMRGCDEDALMHF